MLLMEQLISYLIISIFIFSTSSTPNNTCPTSISSQYCTFQITTLDNDCINFTFQQCTWVECTTIVNHSNVPCTHQQTIANTNWSDCMSTCCQVQNDDQAYKVLQQCDGTSSSSRSNDILMLALALGTVFFIIMSCIISAIIAQNREWWQRTKLNCHNCINCYKSSAVVPSDQIQMKNEQLNASSSHIFQKVNKIDGWSECSRHDMQLIDSTDCVVCLGKNPTIRLKCNHIFHYKCIIQWVRRKTACPLCASTEIEEITIHCSKCFAKKIEGKLRININLDVSRQQICTNCSK